MFTVSVETCFRAAHQLDLPDGSKEKTHNHNWSVKVDVSGSELDDYNMLIDFVELRAKVDNIVGVLSGKPLEQAGFFANTNATAEAVAKYVYEKLETTIPQGLKLAAVEVTEKAGCKAKFTKLNKF